ncbi:MAG: universal stress protein [Desulfomonile tiedjei]|uniref:Universal stress protein n=1 Tax=Desulfomonile tiedjei TaxID=2358 RepID=A0A9D6V2U9_9BACT|nr:universal stress protein [Desulfomonile tiedjei]
MLPKKILLCTDFSENSMPARALAVEFALKFNAELIILHVVNSSRLGYPAFEVGVPFDLQAVLKAIEDSVQRNFAEIKEDFSKSLKELQTMSRIGVPSNEIVKFADEEGVDLIVMGTHGWTGIKHLILGSTAENVVRSAGCPVLTVRALSLESS